jgi:predicted RNA-binding Zn-ribbon protein involved in translation (DUF1610 family)
MNTAIPAVCRTCGKSHLVHQHSVSVSNRGTLACPNCGDVLVEWSGLMFYTLCVSPPKSSHDMPTVNEEEDA